ncbi:MocR-like pyridoxine biosynthesis transcription factor PdxR [Chitinophaga skermanii]|nr:PLP-dependent aminotransferase family protein [Chitinophaga skermanii]
MPKTTPDIALTFIKLRSSLSKPLYMQLYEQLRDGVLNGMLKLGDRLPASRALAKDLQVSRNTVNLAYEQLCLEGYFNSKTGAGTYVCEQGDELVPKKNRDTLTTPTVTKQFQPKINVRPWEKYIEFDTDYEPFQPFRIALPSLEYFPFDTWSRLTSNVYKEIHRYHLGYDSGQGYEPLRAAIASHLRINRSIQCDASQVVIVNGSRQGLHLCMELFMQPGMECWMEDPGYSSVKAAMLRFGGKICPVPISENGLDIQYAVEHYPEAKLAYVTPSHQFPLGITMPLLERMKLLRHAEKKGMLIIEDDYDSEFRYNGRPFPALKGLDTQGHVVYIGTFSKVLFPALRIGYVVMPHKEMAHELTKIKAVTDRQSPVIEQAVLAAFIEQGHFARHLRKMRILYKKHQDELIDLFTKHLGDRVEIHANDAGMHFVLRIVQKKDLQKIKKHLHGSGVMLRPLDDFALMHKDEHAFLIGFTGLTSKVMEKAVLKIKDVLL